MADKESTVRARELGAALRKALRAAGLENKEVARKLGWSPSKVSNMLAARRGVTEADVASVLAICGIGGAERERLLRLAREAHEPSWLQEHGDRLPPKLRTLIDHENSAVAITEYQALLVPGLLQIPDYARSFMRASATIPAEEIEERVDARLKRQELFNRQRPAQFRFFIDEMVLRRTGPGRAVMSEQLHHLLRMSVRPYVQIRILPDTGFHAGFAGSFILIEFAEIEPVLHLEAEVSSTFAERPATIRAYRAVLTQFARTALTEEQSREWIARLATELGEPWKDRDDLAKEQL
jgi:transcriptional regulator with XRE-family HTH domain